MAMLLSCWCYLATLLCCYLGKRHDDLIEELQQMDNDAPATKVLHHTKPSGELELRQNLFSMHLKRVKRVEDSLVDVMTKLNQWNTFFGLDQFGQVLEINPDDEKGGEKGGEGAGGEGGEYQADKSVSGTKGEGTGSLSGNEPGQGLGGGGSSVDGGGSKHDDTSSRGELSAGGI